MPEEKEPRLMTAGEIVAEALEKEAALIPPSLKDRADALLEMAKRYRQSDSRKVRVWPL
jgi:hypothetical protein